MNAESIRRASHYVSRGYLRAWTSADGRLWTYRTLVSHGAVPVWRQSSPKGVAYHTHLYTRIVAGRETDDFEKWLDSEIETPAAQPLQKATSGGRLTPDDWSRLVQFAAAQDVRTPARYQEQLQRWRKTLPGIMEESLREAMDELDAMRKRGERVPVVQENWSKDAPVRVEILKRKAGEHSSYVKAEVTPGRGFWLWQMKHLLEKTARVLHQHRWTILKSPEGVAWFTSDNPVLRLNFNSLSEYDFGGGWGSPGTDIMLPLSPKHLLYTRVGKRPPMRGEALKPEHAALVRRFMAENAHRMIFAEGRDADVVRLRPRVVNAEQFRDERDQWAAWHSEQSAAEKELESRTAPKPAP